VIELNLLNSTDVHSFCVATVIVTLSDAPKHEPGKSSTFLHHAVFVMHVPESL